MKAAEIKVGEAYVVEHEYACRGKATVLEVPVVRMVRVTYAGGGGRVKPYRRDGRADGARVRIEPEGRIVDVSVSKVLRPWGASVAAAEERRVDGIRRVVAVRARLAELGLPNSGLWRGERAGASLCVVQLPFEQFEAWLKRIDPVTIAEEAVREVYARPGDGDEDFEAVLGEVLEEIRQGLAVSDEEISGDG